jgi:hypothetical protein
MTEPPSALVLRSQGSRALARVEVERNVVFTFERSLQVCQVTLAAWAIAMFTLVLPDLLPGKPILLLYIAGMVPYFFFEMTRTRLRKLLEARNRRSSEELVAALRRLAQRWWLPSSVRADALGWLALELLEQGELEQALEALRHPTFSPRKRPRQGMAGLVGEGIRAIIGRLFPEAGWPVVPSEALREVYGDRDPQQDLVSVRAMLRLLEATDTDDASTVARRWVELSKEPLARWPVLGILLQATAARVQPALRLDLDVRIDALSPSARTLVLQHPAVVGDDAAHGYRTAAPAPVEASTVLAVPERLAPKRFLGMGSAVGFGLSIFTPIAMLTSLVLVGPWVTLGLSVGVVVLWWSTSFPSSLKRRARVEPLVSLGIPRSRWLRELAHMRTRNHAGQEWRTALGAFDRDHVMLVLGVRRAEAAVLAGNRREAVVSIAWWLGNLSPQGLHDLDPVGLGAALLRLSAMLGFDASTTLLERVPPRQRPWLPRSGHGDAPRAMALARAMAAACHEDWATAAERVHEALAQPRVRLDGFDHAVYGWLLDRLASRGEPIPRAALGLPQARHRDQARRIGRVIKKTAESRRATEPTG